MMQTTLILSDADRIESELVERFHVPFDADLDWLPVLLSHAGYDAVLFAIDYLFVLTGRLGFDPMQIERIAMFRFGLSKRGEIVSKGIT